MGRSTQCLRSACASLALLLAAVVPSGNAVAGPQAAAAIPDEPLARQLAPDYQQAQATRLLARGRRDDLIAAALLAHAPGAATARAIDDGDAVQRLVARYPHDVLALYTAALLCQLQKTPCAHPEYRQHLLARDSSNAIHWLLVPGGATLSADDRHGAAQSAHADTHFSALLGIVRHALEGQAPRDAPSAWRGNSALALLLRRNEIGRVPWPNYALVMTTCTADAARLPATDATRRDCAAIGALLFGERGNNVATRMVGGTLLRRFAKGTPQAAEALALRRRYVWISEQLPDARSSDESERLNAEEIALGEWEAYQRSAERAGVPRDPPAGWVPRRPELLLLQEERAVPPVPAKPPS
jgi:hypothetical protein